MNQDAIKELLYKMADDLLILGHRNSEWTGLGPILEEDIAFSSMAQDKIGQSRALYSILQELGEQDPDTIAFTRNESQFHNSVFTELPNHDYAFSLVRHFLFDYADRLRFEMLAGSSFTPLAKVSVKIKGEIKYHVFHAETWIKKLSSASDESHSRMQKALNECWNYALGMFEEGPFEKALIQDGVFEGEASLKEKWLHSVSSFLASTTLEIPSTSEWSPKSGGRNGNHTEHLQPLLDEMSEVFRVDPAAEW